MADLGYIDGENVIIQAGFVGQDAGRLPEVAGEMVRDGVEVIVTNSGPAHEAARRATATIPIVMAVSNDPVALGWVNSLNRPGGNMTGQGTISAETWGKRLELLKDAVPGVRRVVVIWNATIAGAGRSYSAIHAAGSSLGIPVAAAPVHGPQDFPGVFQVAASGPSDGLIAVQEPLTLAHRLDINRFALQRGMPSIFEGREFADDGGLLSYGANLVALHRSAAVFVDKILKGGSPAEIPVERAARFDFVVNLRTAQALGLTLPPSIVQQATDTIQ
jgi:putative ABC transport system substrate-binding protein